MEAACLHESARRFRPRRRLHGLHAPGTTEDGKLHGLGGSEIQRPAGQPRRAHHRDRCGGVLHAVREDRYCFAWSFQVNASLKQAGVTTCRWAHLTQCCWVHTDDTLPTKTPTFLASGALPHATSAQNPKGFPIPVDKNLFGAEMVLWETQRGQQDKVGFLRHKAPALAENTYAFGADATSYYASWAKTFGYLDEQFSALNSGFRLTEHGLSTDLGDILRTDTETSMDPVLAFDKQLTLTVMINRPGTVVRYTNHTYTLDATGTKILANGAGTYATNSSALMPATLTFTPSSAELGEHGYVAVYAQAYDAASGERVGEPVVRRYVCQPATLVVAGTLRKQDLSVMGSGVQFGPHVTELALFTKGHATVALTAAASGCTARWAVGDKVSAGSPALPTGSQLAISSSTDTVSIACFDEAGERVGRIWAAHFSSNVDKGIFGGNGTLAPANAVVLEATPSVQRWVLPLFRTGNATKKLSEFPILSEPLLTLEQAHIVS
jgi:hypothetical protein